MRSLNRLLCRDVGYSLATGLLLALAFPPFKTGFFGYVALVPFFILLENKGFREVVRWSYLTGLFIAIFTLFWIGHVTQAGLIGALLVIPLYLVFYGIFHALIVRLQRPRALFFLPFFWISMEYAQSLTELAFPWNCLGYTQSYYLPLIQFAEFTGVLGVSFWVLTLNLVIWYLLRHPLSRRVYMVWAAVIACWFLVPLRFGLKAMRTPDFPARTISVALVQGNVDPFEKWEEGSTENNLILYEQMTHAAMAQKPDLIIWPETALPFYLRAEHQYLERLLDLADSIRTPILTGALDYRYPDEEKYLYYNSAFLIEPGERFLQSYAKMRLVPFSERVPYRNYFPFKYIKHLLYDMALGIGDYARGDEWTVFSTPVKEASPEPTPAAAPFRIKFSVPICYESAFPDLVRRFHQAGAHFLVIITNDAWFGRTTAPYQHARFAVFRAIENRIAIARCANTGVSCLVDASGRTYRATKIFQPAIVVDNLQIHGRETLYSRHGDWFPGLCVLVAAAALVVVMPWTRQAGDQHASSA